MTEAEEEALLREFRTTSSSAFPTWGQASPRDTAHGRLRDATTEFREMSLMSTGKIINMGGKRIDFTRVDKNRECPLPPPLSPLPLSRSPAVPPLSDDQRTGHCSDSNSVTVPRTAAAHAVRAGQDDEHGRASSAVQVSTCREFVLVGSYSILARAR